MLFGLSGDYGVGKDTVADYLVSKYKFVKISLAEVLKLKTSKLINFDLEILKGLTVKNRQLRDRLTDEVFGLTGREWLEILGAGIRELKPEYFIEQIQDMVIELLKSGVNVVIPDARYINEYQWIHSLGGKVFLIKRKGIKSGKSTRYDFTRYNKFDDILYNDGTLVECYKAVDLLL